MKVTFYLPSIFFPDRVWEKSWKEKSSFPDGVILPPILSAQTWIYQTWLRLQEVGIACELSSKMPSEGIVVALASSLESSGQWNEPIPAEVFFVDIVTQHFVHPAADFHLVQNRNRARFLPDSIFLPHWPQPSLIPRDPERGDRFENAYFMGQNYQCHQEIFSSEWVQQLRRCTGIHLEMPSIAAWHDYCSADVAIGLRNFFPSHHFNKPATKLYNAWHAGVPFLGGKESGYLSEGKVGKNYLQASTPSEMIRQLARLKEDLTLRKQLVEEGRAAAKGVSAEAILECWKFLVLKKLPTLAEQFYQRSPRARNYFLIRKKMIRLANRYLYI